MNLIKLTKYFIELRKKVIYSLSSFIFFFLVLFPIRNNIYFILLKPLIKFMPNESKIISIQILSPFIIPIQLLLYISLMLSLPIILFNLYLFIKPALFRHEKIIYLILTILSILLFILGIMFGYLVILPILFKFIFTIKASYITIYTDIYYYFNFVLKTLIIFGFSFLTPVIIFFILSTNLIEINTLKRYRKYFFVVSFIIAAIITPPDVLSQILFAIPMYLLFELGLILYLLLGNKNGCNPSKY